MTSREQFESEYSKIIGSPACSIKELRAGDVYRGKGGDRLSIAWWAWQASREALVVELPEEMKAREALDKGFMCDYAAGVTDTVVQVRENLIAAGIKVKGE